MAHSLLTQEPKVSSPSRLVKTARILLVDDHPMVRRGLVELITDQDSMEVRGEAETPADALALLGTTSPDLVIVDISLKEGSGIDVIKQMKARRSDVRILVFSLHAELLYAEHVLRAGAMGFVNKQESSDTLIDAMSQILNGQIYLSRRMADRMLHRVVNGKEQLERSPLETLSDRELEVFGLVGQGQTTRQIAAKLHLSPKTIETHRENIKKKLGLSNSVELTHRAVRWVLEQA